MCTFFSVLFCTFFSALLIHSVSLLLMKVAQSVNVYNVPQGEGVTVSVTVLLLVLVLLLCLDILGALLTMHHFHLYIIKLIKFS